jgi:hypothetical protein
MLIFKKEKWLLDISTSWESVEDVRIDLIFYNGWVVSSDNTPKDELVKKGYIIRNEWCEEK